MKKKKISLFGWVKIPKKHYLRQKNSIFFTLCMGWHSTPKKQGNWVFASFIYANKRAVALGRFSPPSYARNRRGTWQPLAQAQGCTQDCTMGYMVSETLMVKWNISTKNQPKDPKPGACVGFKTNL